MSFVKKRQMKPLRIFEFYGLKDFYSMFVSCLQLLFYPSCLFLLGIVFLVGGYFSEYLKDFKGQKTFSTCLNVAGINWLLGAFFGKSFEFLSVIAGEGTIQYFEQVKAILPLLSNDSMQVAQANALLPMISIGTKNILMKSLLGCGFMISGVPLMIALACTVAAVIFGIAILISFIIRNSKVTV